MLNFQHRIKKERKSKGKTHVEGQESSVKKHPQTQKSEIQMSPTFRQPKYPRKSAPPQETGLTTRPPSSPPSSAPSQLSHGEENRRQQLTGTHCGHQSPRAPSETGPEASDAEVAEARALVRPAAEEKACMCSAGSRLRRFGGHQQNWDNLN